MKKIIAIAICLALLCSFMAGCINIPADKTPDITTTGLSGEAIARILAARDQLGATTFDGFRFFDTESDSPLASISLRSLSSNEHLGFVKDGNDYLWTDFSDYSNQSSYFLGLFRNIETSAEQAAETIAYARQNITVTDAWVADGIEQVMLKVDNNGVSVYNRYELNGTKVSRLYKRYNNGKGQIVYEQFYSDESDSNTVESRILYIPGVRYEYYSDTLFFVADNDNGYWNILMLDVRENWYSIQNIIMTNSACYSLAYSVCGPDYAGGAKATYDNLSVISRDLECDIMRFNTNTVQLFLRGFSGIESLKVTAEESDVGYPGEKVNTYEGKYWVGISKTPTLVLDNSSELNINETFADGKVTYSEGNVEFLTDGYYPSATLTVEGESAREKMIAVKDFLDDAGFACKYDIDAFADELYGVEILAESLLSKHELNGESINSYESITTGLVAEKSKLDAFYETIDSVKTLSTINKAEQEALPSDISFSALSVATEGTISIENGKLIISGYTLALNDLRLVDTNTDYKLKLVLLKTIEEDTAPVAQSKHFNLSLSKYYINDASAYYGYLLQAGLYTDYSYIDIPAIPLLPDPPQANIDFGSLSMPVEVECALPEVATIGQYTLAAFFSTESDVRVSGMTPITLPQGATAPTLPDDNIIDISIGGTGLINFNAGSSLESNTISSSDIPYSYIDIFQIFREKAKALRTMISPNLEIYDEDAGEWYFV
ncbi:MAG: hypothetical protein EOM87_01910, partial [Clostridia bacterium]|nr:hypothetical protein [Clostridia bacterium]